MKTLGARERLRGYLGAMLSLHLVLSLYYPHYWARLGDLVLTRGDWLRDLQVQRSRDDRYWRCWHVTCNERLHEDAASGLAFDARLIVPPPRVYTAPRDRPFYSATIVESKDYEAQGGFTSGYATALLEVGKTAPDEFGANRGKADLVARRINGANYSITIAEVRWQPIPVDWRVVLPTRDSALITAGDRVEVRVADMPPDVNAFVGHVISIGPGAQGNEVRIRPDRDYSEWISAVYYKHLSPDVFPLDVRLKVFQQFTGPEEGSQQVPASAIAHCDGQPCLWAQYENFLVPLSITVGADAGMAGWRQVRLVPGMIGLPIAQPAWAALTPWQRSRLVWLQSFQGPKPHPLEYLRLMPQPQAAWRPGLYLEKSIL